MLSVVSTIVFIYMINNVYFSDPVRPNNIIYLFPSAFTISRKLMKFAGKIIYFCLPNLICYKISKSCIELN